MKRTSFVPVLFLIFAVKWVCVAGVIITAIVSSLR